MAHTLYLSQRDQGRFIPLGRPSVNAIGVVPICHCKGGRFMSARPSTNVSTAPLHLIFFWSLLMVFCVQALNVVA